MIGLVDREGVVEDLTLHWERVTDYSQVLVYKLDIERVAVVCEVITILDKRNNLRRDIFEINAIGFDKLFGESVCFKSALSNSIGVNWFDVPFPL